MNTVLTEDQNVQLQTLSEDLLQWLEENEDMEGEGIHMDIETCYEDIEEFLDMANDFEDYEEMFETLTNEADFHLSRVNQK